MSEGINLSKAKSILDAINIEYEREVNDEKLTVELNVYLNRRLIGVISSPVKSSWNKYDFKSLEAIIDNLSDDDLAKLKRKIESEIEKTVESFKNFI